MADGKNIGDAILAKLSPLMQLAANAIGEPGFIRYLEATASQIKQGLNKRLSDAGLPSMTDQAVEYALEQEAEISRLSVALDRIAALKGEECAAAPALAAQALKGDDGLHKPVDTITPRRDPVGESAARGSAAKH
jgi:hypothetical protein